MIRLPWTIFIVFFAFANVTGQDNLATAQTYMQGQEYAKALPIWESCMEVDTTNKKCVEQAGQASYRLGLMSKAKKYFHSIELDLEYFKAAAISLSNIYEQQDNIPKAIKYNTRLRDSFPDNPIYHRKIANLFIKASLPKEAFVSYAKALDLNPDDVITIRGITELFISNEQYSTADSLLAHGLSIDETNVGLSLLRARNYYKQQDYENTVITLRKLTGVIDFSNYYNKMMGYSLLQIDSVDLSIRYLEKSLVNEGDPEYAHYYLSNAYELKEDKESALFHLEKAIEAGTSGGLHSYHRNKARILNGENQTKEAIKAYEWAYKLRQDPILLFYLARASDKYYKDKSIAIRYYDRYIKSSDDNDEYKKYSKDRRRYLKEIQHLNVSK